MHNKDEAVRKVLPKSEIKNINMNNDLFVKAAIFLLNLGIIHHRQGVLHTYSVFRPLINLT